MKITPYVSAAALLILAGCAKPAADETATATAAKASGADEAAVVAVRDAWAEAYKTGDAARLASLYAPDAVHMANHTPTMVGPAGVQSGIEAELAQMTPTDMTITGEKTVIDGDLAYDRGTWSVTATPKAGGAAIADSGRYIAILQRQPDGSWKIVEGIGNSATPLPQPAPAKK